MIVRDLIKELEKFNPEAPISVVVHNFKEKFSLAWGKSEGVAKANCQEVNLYVDRLCGNEKEER